MWPGSRTTGLKVSAEKGILWIALSRGVVPLIDTEGYNLHSEPTLMFRAAAEPFQLQLLSLVVRARVAQASMLLERIPTAKPDMRES